MMAGFDENGTLDAAVLLLALGEETAAEVFKHLTPKEVQSLGEVMARTQYTTKDHVNRVLERFHEVAAGQSTLVDDSNAYVQGVLRRALGEEKAGMLIDRITHGSDVTGIESLRWMDAASISELVRNEHPQIIASILVHLERDQASAILLQLSEELRADVVLRIATLDGIQPNALKELNEALSRVLAGGEQVKRSRLGGSKTAAEIINFLGATAEVSLLDSIREEDPELAQSIEDQMFTFDDLINLDDKAIQLLLREIQSEDLIVALKGAEPALRDKIFKNMSQRAAESVREDLEGKGPVKLSEVEAQHKEILKIVRRLADAGQIAIGGGGGDEFVGAAIARPPGRKRLAATADLEARRLLLHPARPPRARGTGGRRHRRADCRRLRGRTGRRTVPRRGGGAGARAAAGPVGATALGRDPRRAGARHPPGRDRGR